MRVGGVQRHLQQQQPRDLRRRRLAQHGAKADHGRAGCERRVDQQREVQLDVRPARSSFKRMRRSITPDLISVFLMAQAGLGAACPYLACCMQAHDTFSQWAPQEATSFRVQVV